MEVKWSREAGVTWPGHEGGLAGSGQGGEEGHILNVFGKLSLQGLWARPADVVGQPGFASGQLGGWCPAAAQGCVPRREAKWAAGLSGLEFRPGWGSEWEFGMSLVGSVEP